MRSIIAKRDEADCDEDLTEAQRRIVNNYVARLHEPNRSILQSRLDGMTAREIARRVEMDVKAVCRILAQVYADLGDQIS